MAISATALAVQNAQLIMKCNASDAAQMGTPACIVTVFNLSFIHTPDQRHLDAIYTKLTLTD